MSDEQINSVKTSDYEITPELSYYGTKIRVEFNGSCLKQGKITFTYVKIVNIYIADELTGSNSGNHDPTVKNALFGTVTLAKNVDTDSYGNSGYGIGFDRIGSFLHSGIGFGRNVTIFGVDMHSSVHVKKKKDIHWPYIDCRKNVFN